MCGYSSISFLYVSCEIQLRKMDGTRGKGRTARHDYRGSTSLRVVIKTVFPDFAFGVSQSWPINADRRYRFRQTSTKNSWICACACVFFTQNAHRIVQIASSNAHAAYRVTGQFLSYKMFYFFFPSNMYMKHLAKDTAFVRNSFCHTKSCNTKVYIGIFWLSWKCLDYFRECSIRQIFCTPNINLSRFLYFTSNAQTVSNG